MPQVIAKKITAKRVIKGTDAPRGEAGRFSVVVGEFVAQVKGNPALARDFLKGAGILTASGKVSKHYR